MPSSSPRLMIRLSNQPLARPKLWYVEAPLVQGKNVISDAAIMMTSVRPHIMDRWTSRQHVA